MPSKKALVPIACIVMSGAAFANQPAKPQPQQKAPAAQPQAGTQPPAVRDWSRVDTNRDNLVSPEEMEKYLAENPGPLKKAS